MRFLIENLLRSPSKASKRRTGESSLPGSVRLAVLSRASTRQANSIEPNSSGSRRTLLRNKLTADRASATTAHWPSKLVSWYRVFRFPGSLLCDQPSKPEGVFPSVGSAGDSGSIDPENVVEQPERKHTARASDAATTRPRRPNREFVTRQQTNHNTAAIRSSIRAPLHVQTLKSFRRQDPRSDVEYRGRNWWSPCLLFR